MLQCVAVYVDSSANSKVNTLPISLREHPSLLMRVSVYFVCFSSVLRELSGRWKHLTRHIFEIEEKSVLFAVQSSSTAEKPRRRKKKFGKKRQRSVGYFQVYLAGTKKGD